MKWNNSSTDNVTWGPASHTKIAFLKIALGHNKTIEWTKFLDALPDAFGQDRKIKYFS